MTLEVTPYTLPLAATAIISGWLALLVWRRRPGPGVIPLVAVLIGVVWWTILYDFEISVDDVATKRFLAGLQYISIALIPISWLAFALEYTGREKWLSWRYFLPLMAEPIVIILLAVTNNHHQLFYTGVTLEPEGTYTMLITHKTAAFWVHWAYSYVVLATATILLLNSLWRSPQAYRGQITALLIGAVAPWSANLLFVSGLNPLPLFDFTPVAFSVSGLAFAYSITRFRLMDIVPVARDMVIESMSDAMLLLDNRERIVDANPTALLVLSSKYDTSMGKNSIVGKPVQAVLAQYEDVLGKYADVDEVTEVISVDDAQGAQHHYDMRMSPLRNRSDNLIGRVIVLRDITALKQASERIHAQNLDLTQANEALRIAEHEAMEANRLKSEFLATMSHELRTPLNAIIGFSDLMIDNIAGELNPKQYDYVSRILNNSERLLMMINDLLDVSKIEAGRLEIVMSPFSPGELISGVTSHLHGLAEKKQLTLNTYISDCLPPTVTADAQRVEQILTNLIDNAIRFTKQGGVDVRADCKDDDWWTIEVADTGIGIPSHALEYIFDEFRQVDGTTQREHGGTGLGLSVVKRLTLLMKGRINVQSEVGKGSTFTIHLPLRQPDSNLAASSTTTMRG